MTWAARYSDTDEPELTIYHFGIERERVSMAEASSLAERAGGMTTLADLRADIAARVPTRECTEAEWCTRHAMPDGRCRAHGGRDEL